MNMHTTGGYSEKRDHASSMDWHCSGSMAYKTEKVSYCHLGNLISGNMGIFFVQKQKFMIQNSILLG